MNPQTKLNNDSVEEILVELREGTPCRQIAEWFGVSPSLVQQIKEGKRWRIPGYNYPVLKLDAELR
jgi:transposase